MIQLINDCMNCIYYCEGFERKLAKKVHCIKSQKPFNCDFVHFFDTWRDGMQQDAIFLLSRGEILPGIKWAEVDNAGNRIQGADINRKQINKMAKLGYKVWEMKEA